MSEKNGIDKAREMAEQLKQERAVKEEQDKKEMSVVLQDMKAISENAELAKMYADNATVGADNLEQLKLPVLKTFDIGRTKSRLLDGSLPNDGWYFYNPTREQIQNPICHILSISGGYRPKDQNGRLKFTQLMSGVIVNDNKYIPFLMYVKGLSLSYMWEFAKQAAVYTKQKPIPIPMFALSVKLHTGRVEGKDDHGNPTMVLVTTRYEIMSHEDGSPVLVTDPGEFQYLRDHVAMVEELHQKLIDKSDAGEAEEILMGASTPAVEPTGPDKEPVNPSDVPF